MSKAEGQNEAINIAIAKLAKMDFSDRTKNLGYSLLDKENLVIHAFGADSTVDLKSFEVKNRKTGQSVKPDLKIILLHYLLFEKNISETGNLISFRELPGGQFYLLPYQSRSVNILTSRIKNDIGLLRKNLDRLKWTEVGPGDIGARIQAVGNVYVNLVCYVGDEEMPPSADVLYDSSIRNVFNTEDVAVIASLTCRTLI